jgi:hypothetical protein
MFREGYGLSLFGGSDLPISLLMVSPPSHGNMEASDDGMKGRVVHFVLDFVCPEEVVGGTIIGTWKGFRTVRWHHQRDSKTIQDVSRIGGPLG